MDTESCGLIFAHDDRSIFQCVYAIARSDDALLLSAFKQEYLRHDALEPGILKAFWERVLQLTITVLTAIATTLTANAAIVH